VLGESHPDTLRTMNYLADATSKIESQTVQSDTRA